MLSKLIQILNYRKAKMRSRTLIRIESSSIAERTDGSVSDNKRILSNASEAFDINSRRKISLFLKINMSAATNTTVLMTGKTNHTKKKKKNI